MIKNNIQFNMSTHKKNVKKMEQAILKLTQTVKPNENNTRNTKRTRA